MRLWIVTLGAAAAAAGTAQAQYPFVSKPIDTDKLVIAPANTAAAATGATTAGTIRTFGKTVAGVIEDNGFVRTFNNLFGKRATPPAVQPGLSPLPVPGSFASTGYKNSFVPAAPRMSTFGQTPNVPVVKGPSANK
jgi:hypothetical protein